MVMVISWCILDSLGRNLDWLLSDKQFFLKTHKYYQATTFQIFLSKLVIKIQVDNCQLIVYGFFLSTRRKLASFQMLGKTPWLTQLLNSNWSGLIIEDPHIFRGGSRTAATSKMERFVMIVNGWKPLTIITKRSTLDVLAVLDPPLILIILTGMSS